MREAEQEPLKDESNETFGFAWTRNLDYCSLPVPDYSSLVNFGYSTKQIVSYLRSYESTPEAIFENELVLAKNGGGSVRLHYNLDKIVEETLKNKCKGQIECASYFSLCFSESSTILYCDEE